MRGLISVAEAQLAGLSATSGVADAAYDDAVTKHGTAVSTQTTGVAQLTKDLAAAQSTHDQGVAALQVDVDVSKSTKDAASIAKGIANIVLSAERTRLDSEISAQASVISKIQDVLGIDTVVDPNAGVNRAAQVGEEVAGATRDAMVRNGAASGDTDANGAASGETN